MVQMWGNHLPGGGLRSPQDFSRYYSNEDFLQRCESLWEKGRLATTASMTQT